MISHFQLKFVNALIVIFALLLVLMVVLIIAELRPRKLSNERLSAAKANMAFEIWVVVVVSGLRVCLHPVPASSTSPSVFFRALATFAAQTHLDRTTRRSPKPQVMATRPCIRAISLGAMVDDLTVDASNQRAMSLSSTQTESLSLINACLFSQNSEDGPDPDPDPDPAPAPARCPLSETPNSCLVVARDVKSYRNQELDPSFADRVPTW